MQASVELGTWAGVAGTFVQTIVLGVLIWQVLVNRRQTGVAEQTLVFAKQQHQDLLQEMAKDRVAAVRPVLVMRQVKSGEGTYIDGDSKEHPIPTVTYELDNVGRGPGVNITVSLWSEDGGDRPISSERIQGISSGGQDTVTLWFYSLPEGKIVVTFEDLYGNRFERLYEASWGCDPYGEIYPSLYDWTRGS